MRPTLARTPEYLGGHFRSRGQFREAADADEECADIRRQIVKSAPATRGNLVTALNNAAFDMRRLERYLEASEAEKEAVDIRKEIIRQNKRRSRNWETPSAIGPTLQISSTTLLLITSTSVKNATLLMFALKLLGYARRSPRSVNQHVRRPAGISADLQNYISGQVY